MQALCREHRHPDAEAAFIAGAQDMLEWCHGKIRCTLYRGCPTPSSAVSSHERDLSRFFDVSTVRPRAKSMLSEALSTRPELQHTERLRSEISLPNSRPPQATGIHFMAVIPPGMPDRFPSTAKVANLTMVPGEIGDDCRIASFVSARGRPTMKHNVLCLDRITRCTTRRSRSMRAR